LECIIVDDGSSDNTNQIVNSIDDDRLVYIRHPVNKGASAARNTGIKHSKGEFIAFLDDDDEWLSTKLEKQVPLLQGLSERFGMVYCWMDYYNDEGELLHEHHPTLKGNVFHEVLDAQRLGGCPTLLVRREVFDEVQGFDESLPRGNDGDFIRRVCRKYKVDLIPEVLVKVYTRHGYPQIGSNDKKGIENHIFSQLAKIKKFENELKFYPQETENIFFDLARNYAKLGNWRNSVNYYCKGINVNPFSIKLYFRLFHHLRLLL
jgi:glycosyltransferase involved in cell wall biosynthesis